MSRAPLPIDDVLGDVLAALREHTAAVLEAPPGAGKTTRVPPALADEPWAAGGRIVVLEPRRVAARAAAKRMAEEAGGTVGGRIGLTTRDDRRRSADTRVEVVTEGVLVNRLQRDPSLPGVAAVVLDEFHERSLDADLALAFARESQQALREDLRIVVMSATLDGDRVAAALGGAPVVRSDGRLHPVTVEHVDRDPLDDLAPDVAAAVERSLREESGDVLVFLPGAREIRAVTRALQIGDGVDVRPLHGSLPPAEQDAALSASPRGRRKIVLSTDLAESSVTVPGVTVVVDAGLSREPRLDPRTGMSRLVTVRASRASADQRAGRAGRLQPGRCVRLWSPADHAARDPQPRPEILQADLTPAVLQVAAWGAAVDELVWLDPPPATVWEAGRSLLRDLDALDDAGRITDHGRRINALPVHPRIGHMLVTAAAHGWVGTGLTVAALLGERDVLGVDRDRPDADLGTRVRLVADRGASPPTGRLRTRTLQRVRRNRERLKRLLGDDGPVDPEHAGAVLALAYPDRVGVARGTRGRYLLANGRGARIDDRDPLAAARFVVVADVDDAGADARVHLAAAVDLEQLRAALGPHLRREDVLGWDGDRHDVVAERRETIGHAVLTRSPLDRDLDAAGAGAALLEGVRAEGLELLPWDRETRSWLARARFVRRHVDPSWPRMDDEALLADLEDWLLPFLTAARRRSDLDRVPLADALASRAGWDRARRLDELAPTHLRVPSGSRIRLDYDGDVPVLAVKLQEMFGATRTPTVGGVPVVVHLLSPARRPLQVTQDLAGFWRTTYADVRAEMRGRYPKHPWPEDPVTAVPTRHTKHRQRRR